MPNEQNLIPNSERTPEQIREMASNGGVKSGKVRRQKADLRKAAQAILEATYTDKTSGKQYTGLDMFMHSIAANISNPQSKNWGKAMDCLIQLTGANITPEQKAKFKAEADLAKTRAKQLKAAESVQIETESDGFLEALNGTAAVDWEDTTDDSDSGSNSTEGEDEET